MTDPADIIINGLKRKSESDAQVKASEQTLAAKPFNDIQEAIAHATLLLISFLDGYEGSTKVNNFPTSVKTPDIAEVVKAVKALKQPDAYNDQAVVKSLGELKAAFGKLNIPESFTLKNSSDIANQLAQAIMPTLKAVQALKLDPKITVEPTPVTVQPVDLQPILDQLATLKKATDKVSKTLTELRFPTTNVPTDPLIKYTPADIDDASTVQYFGFTDILGAWYIRKFDTSVSPKTLRFAFGQTGYTAAWTARASQTYAIWGT